MADEQDRMDVDEIEVKEPTPKPTSTSKPRFEVKKWTAVAFWSWDMQIENCAICRNHLMEPCIECQPNSMNNNNNTSEECIPAWGVCNHAFHLHCIRRWLKTRNACPLDNTDWTYQKFGN
ncbi:E3 ubiquitin-protein ligase complex Scf subunit, putative [Candida dubliniensis CD36]|uniref:RING-box protein Hrt1 homologue, putative n=1 Tax=Candida dubliniensis (strain CD36 / ATCC MYA-646 / CBS 7987 / NCPF 3949 / NRRL Y-17841) TaxID=573826 RepID=B9WDL2_CANDC|nr:E3 ubiquitin-protein ligase complex Scf subunit, putative [Candida dubliniensis CD36]CAX42768.1 E3 ubiquitin-protein ligase complex Scf subunit, putative [Candida dubliniensis CD36]